MTKTFLRVPIYIFLIASYSSCREKKAVYNTEAIHFNDKAVEFIKVRNFDSALFYLDKATKTDTTYYVAYGNKCSVYCSLKNFKRALEEIQKEISVKPDLAEAWAFAGMLNDKLGDTLNAMKYYTKSIDIFDSRISNPGNDKNLVADKLNRAISLILSGQEITGHNELKKLKEANPKDKSLDGLLNISKEEYLNLIFSN